MDETIINIAEQNIRIIRLRAQLAAKRQAEKLTRLTAHADALEAELARMNTVSLPDAVEVSAEYKLPQRVDNGFATTGRYRN